MPKRSGAAAAAAECCCWPACPGLAACGGQASQAWQQQAKVVPPAAPALLRGFPLTAARASPADA
jgi:hypothetical protein